MDETAQTGPQDSNAQDPRKGVFIAPAPAGTQADTNIYINRTNTSAPITVENSPTLTQPVAQPAPPPEAPSAPPPPATFYSQSQFTDERNETSQRIGANTIHEPTITTTTKTVPKTTLNWGKVLKGVALVTAVVVAGVVGFGVLQAAAGWALSTGVGSGIAGLLMPVVTTIGEALSFSAGFLSALPGIIWSGLTTFSADIGLTSLAASLAPTVPTAAVAHGAGLIGAGAGVAAMTPIVAKHLPDLNLFSHGTEQVSTTQVQDHTTTVPADAPSHDFFPNLFHKKAAVMQQAAEADGTLPPPPVTAAAQNAANHQMAHHDMHNNHTAAELGHHAMHGEHSSAAPSVSFQNRNKPQADTDPASDPQDSREEREKRSWTSRFSANNTGPRQPLPQSENGTPSYAAAIQSQRAARPAAEMGPRSSFSTSLDAERAQLDAALGEPTR